jgi:hypothetical protein
VEKEQIQGKILISYLKGDLGADKAEVPAHFDKELPKAVEEPAMQFRLCPKCEQALSDAANAMRRHAALMQRAEAVSVARGGHPTEEQRQQFKSELVATFGDAQSAWDAYRNHLIEHGFLPS